jgi:hypothetical protein
MTELDEFFSGDEFKPKEFNNNWNREGLISDANETVEYLRELYPRFFLGKFFLTEEECEGDEEPEFLEEDFIKYLKKDIPSLYEKVTLNSLSALNVYMSLLRYEEYRLPLKTKIDDALESWLALETICPTHSYLSLVEMVNGKVIIKDIGKLEELSESSNNQSKKSKGRDLVIYGLELFSKVAHQELERIAYESTIEGKVEVRPR